MLPKKNRITRAVYNDLFKKGKNLFSPLFSVKYTEDKSEKRFSVVIPKKVLSLAHDRNSLRRLTYDIIHDLLSDFKTGHYIFIFKKNTGESKKEDLITEVKSIIKKI